MENIDKPKGEEKKAYVGTPWKRLQRRRSEKKEEDEAEVHFKLDHVQNIYVKTN